ncbi:MAG: cobalt-precorrin-6A reductase [Rhizobiaceae bacterium]|nr:cobalt-precorrin-6A reductase [Rhizobiaceae bacterium]
MSKTILILSGTAEGFALAQQLHEEHPNWRIISSLAGRTKNPNLPIGEIRIGGFGGTEGLIDYISKQKVDKVIDATHPYAKTISENAKQAAKTCAIEYQKIERPAWQQTEGDNWTEVQSIEEAADIAPKNATVFLALGRQYIDAFQHRSDCHFIVRMVDHSDDVPLRSYKLILGRPNENSEDEQKLFLEHEITHLITRNSGGEKSYAKIIAARDAKIPVIMIQRPKD